MNLRSAASNHPELSQQTRIASEPKATGRARDMQILSQTDRQTDAGQLNPALDNPFSDMLNSAAVDMMGSIIAKSVADIASTALDGIGLAESAGGGGRGARAVKALGEFWENFKAGLAALLAPTESDTPRNGQLKVLNDDFSGPTVPLPTNIQSVSPDQQDPAHTIIAR